VIGRGVHASSPSTFKRGEGVTKPMQKLGLGKIDMLVGEKKKERKKERRT
jgi:hypothetical protein